MTIATDIICGFPNETEADFDETMDMMAKYRFHICNISQFYPRPGTPAARMKRINTKIVKGRSRRFSTLFNSFAPYDGLEGQVIQVWFGVEIDKTGTKSVGHAKNYTKVLVEKDLDLPGCRASVKLHKVGRFHVEGTIIDGTVVRLVPVPGDATQLRARRKGGSNKENNDEDTENCDMHNYRVDDGGPEGEEDSACCGGGGCGGGQTTCGSAEVEGGGCCGGKGKSHAGGEQQGGCCGGKGKSHAEGEQQGGCCSGKGKSRVDVEGGGCCGGGGGCGSKGAPTKASIQGGCCGGKPKAGETCKCSPLSPAKESAPKSDQSWATNLIENLAEERTAFVLVTGMTIGVSLITASFYISFRTFSSRKR